MSTCSSQTENLTIFFKKTRQKNDFQPIQSNTGIKIRSIFTSKLSSKASSVRDNWLEFKWRLMFHCYLAPDCDAGERLLLQEEQLVHVGRCGQHWDKPDLHHRISCVQVVVPDVVPAPDWAVSYSWINEKGAVLLSCYLRRFFTGCATAFDGDQVKLVKKRWIEPWGSFRVNQQWRESTSLQNPARDSNSSI